jgi:hypothetical protein
MPLPMTPRPTKPIFILASDPQHRGTIISGFIRSLGISAGLLIDYE